MYLNSKLISARRESVIQSYNSARAENLVRFLEGDDRATSEYIYPNQLEYAASIVNLYYINKCRVVSVQKKTKVGADGLMIEVAKLLATHSDDNFVANPANIRLISVMSNAGWEKDMIDKAPNCFTPLDIFNDQSCNSFIGNVDLEDRTAFGGL